MFHLNFILNRLKQNFKERIWVRRIGMLPTTIVLRNVIDCVVECCLKCGRPRLSLALWTEDGRLRRVENNGSGGGRRGSRTVRKEEERP